jgi:hypothetical protein
LERLIQYPAPYETKTSSPEAIGRVEASAKWQPSSSTNSAFAAAALVRW